MLLSSGWVRDSIQPEVNPFGYIDFLLIEAATLKTWPTIWWAVFPLSFRYSIISISHLLYQSRHKYRYGKEQIDRGKSRDGKEHLYSNSPVSLSQGVWNRLLSSIPEIPYISSSCEAPRADFLRADAFPYRESSVTRASPSSFLGYIGWGLGDAYLNSPTSFGRIH